MTELFDYERAAYERSMGRVDSALDRLEGQLDAIKLQVSELVDCLVDAGLIDLTITGEVIPPQEG